MRRGRGAAYGAAMRTALLSLSLLSLAACAVDRTYTSAVLQPVVTQVIAPADLKLDAIAFELPRGDGVIRGNLIPAKGTVHGTVVLCPRSGANASMLHPVWSFLHEAGFHVVTFDWRGTGNSSGTVGMGVMSGDLDAVLSWVRDRSEVDRSRIALYGMGIGSTIALKVAANEKVAAVVADGVVSPLAAVKQEASRQRGRTIGSIEAGFLEFSHVPDGMEPEDNVDGVRAPLLLLAGSAMDLEELRATMRTHIAARDSHSLAVMNGTGSGPHGLWTHGAQYREAVSSFLRDAFAGTPQHMDVSWTRATDGGDSGWYEAKVARKGETGSPWAVRVAAVEADGTVTTRDVWLEAAATSTRIKVKSEPGAMGAMRFGSVTKAEDGSWQPSADALAEAAVTWDRLRGDWDTVVNGAPDAEQARAIAARMTEAVGTKPLHPVLAAQCAPAMAAIGTALARSAAAADREAAVAWLERALAARPAQPKLHWWVDRSRVTAGFRWEDELREAAKTLEQLRAPK